MCSEFMNNLFPKTRYIILLVFSIILSLSINVSSLSQNVSTAESLRHLFVVYRHGDRAPISLYPNDRNPSTFWKEGLGQLTNIGKQQHYELGNFLRQRYSNFLTNNIQEIYVRSSAVDRCLESAAANLAALYQPKDLWVWNQNLLWQPAPIHSMPVDIDPMMTTDSKCPEFDREEARIRDGDEARAFIEKYKELFQDLSNFTGSHITDWEGADHLYDVLFIEKIYNLSIPEWVGPIYDTLSTCTDFSFYIPYSTQLSQRLRGGSMVGDVVSIMEKKVQDPSAVPQKVHMYSTHDTIVAAFLSALSLFNNIKPPYFATVLIELHENGPHNHTVRLFYRNDTRVAPHPLVLPGCEADCPLGHFVRLTEDVIPINWKEECGLKEDEKPFSNLALIVISSMGVVVLLLLLSTAVMLCLRCPKEKSGVRYHRVPELTG